MKLYITKDTFYMMATRGIDALLIYDRKPYFDPGGIFTPPRNPFHNDETEVVNPSWDMRSTIMSGKTFRKLLGDQAKVDEFYDKYLVPTYNDDFVDYINLYEELQDIEWKYGVLKYKELASKFEREGMEWWRWILEIEVDLTLM